MHGLIDRTALYVGSRFMRKYFREGVDSPSFRQHLDHISLELPLVDAEGGYEVRAETLAGRLEAAFRVAQWPGDHYPVIIYHHGASEIPFDYGFRRIFPSEKLPVKVNLLLVRAPFHRSLKDFQQGIRTLSNVVAMLAVSVYLIEKLLLCCRERGISQTLVAGTSLGGFISNLHHIYYNSADVYTPLLAGMAMNDAYLRSAYSRAVAQEAKDQPDAIDSILNFEADFASRDSDNVYPLLARFDQIIRYKRQKASYGGRPITTIAKGHTTGALSYRQLRHHVFKHLEL